jgi:hypothetical protein
MTAPDKFDRQLFQSLLANAFSVQQSGMSHQSLAAIIEIQRTISDGGIDADSAMNLIADRTRAVANASGIGIALLEANQLVHRAGNGSASQIVGSHWAAVLGTSSHHHSRREILRVENAYTDSRIEADICRQFDASALLMVPIYREGMMIGVLEVLFNEPHQFGDPEVRAYQLMATLAGDANLLHLQRPAARFASSTVSGALWRMMGLQQLGAALVPPSQPNAVKGGESPSPFESALASVRRRSQQLRTPRLNFQRWQVMVDQVRERALSKLQDEAERLRLARARLPRFNEFTGYVWYFRFRNMFAGRQTTLNNLQWNAAAACLVIALAIAAAMTRHHARIPEVANAPLPVTNSSSPLTPAGATAEPTIETQTIRGQSPTRRLDADAPNTTFRRVRVGKNEVDYVADDVTIRRFQSFPTTKTSAVSRKVKFGEDVTVRYFDSQSVPSGEPQASTAEQPLKN